MKTRKKLIEVALPLDAINAASVREKSIRHGHPSTLHLWWARRPLAAARAVIFAQMVDDPSAHPELFPTEVAQETERQRLFKIIEEMVKWENTTNDDVLDRARNEIWVSWKRTCADNADHPRAAELFNPDKLPAFHDPFAGGGSLPLEAQRLGLEAYASDLNPVAVLINKAMIEIPPKFAGRPPVNPEWRSEWREKRKEEGGSGALSGDDCLAKSDGSRERGISDCSAIAQRGDLRDAIAIDSIGRVGSDEYCGGVDQRIRQGENTISGNSPGISIGNGDLADVVRTDRMVPNGRDTEFETSTGRGQPDSDNASPEIPKILTLTPHSSSLFPRTWKGAQGLAEDVRYYGKWMRDEAEKRIGHLYPKVEVTEEMIVDRPDLKPYIGKKLTVIAWIWARTVKSPNPAFAHVDVPLASTFMLSTKPGKEAYIEPVIEGDRYRFTVKVGKPVDPEAAKNGTKLGRGANFQCVMSGTAIPGDYIKAEGKAGRLGSRMMAIVAEGERGRIYLPSNVEHESIANSAASNWKPENELIGKCRDQLPLYGMNTFADIFTPRQLVALTTFSDLVSEDYLTPRPHMR